MASLLTYPYLNIYLHEGPKPVLELQWRHYVGGGELREAVTQALHLSQEHQVKGWVVDDRQQGAIRPRDLEWAEQAILGPLNALGLERFAQLEAFEALHRRTVDAMYQHILPAMGFAFQRFEDINLARAWASGH